MHPFRCRRSSTAGVVFLLGLCLACAGRDSSTAPVEEIPAQGVWELTSASFSDGMTVFIFEPPVFQMELTLRDQIVRQVFEFQGTRDTSFGVFTVEDDIITFFSFADDNVNIAVYTDSTMTIFTPPDLVSKVFGLENFHETDFLIKVSDLP